MCSFESRLQRFHSGLGQHQRVPAQDVVDVDALNRQHVDVRNVARGEPKAGIDLGAVDNQRVLKAELVEMRLQRLGLALRHGGPVEHDDAAVLGLGRQGMPQRERANLLGKVDRMATRRRPERAATAAEEVDLGGAMTGRAGALLPIHLLAGAIDLGAVLDVVGAGLALGQLPHHATLQDIGARLEAEDVIRHGDAASRLALESRDLQFHHAPSFASAAGAASASRNLPGFGTSCGSGFFTASRTVIQPPLLPGTAPSTRMRPRSTSVCTTLRLSVVTRSTPMWPAIFLFLKVLPGSWRPPVEPCERCEIETPWLARSPARFQRFIGPAQPLPVEVPVTSTNCPTTKWSAVISAPTGISSFSCTRNSASLRLGSTLAAAK